MSRLLQRLARAVRRRPVRVAEALLVIAAAVGVTVAPELRESITTLAAVLGPAAVGVAAGEAAQTKTHSKAYVYEDLQGGDASHDDRLPDAGEANPPEPGRGDPQLPDLPNEG